MRRFLGIALDVFILLVAVAAAVEAGRSFADGDPRAGTVFAMAAAFGGWVVWSKFSTRRGTRPEATALDALVAAALFLFCGSLGLYAALSGDVAAVIAGGIAAAILFPFAFLILFGLWRLRSKGADSPDKNQFPPPT